MYMVRNQIATMANCLGPFIFYNDMQIKYRILLVIIIIIIKIITIIGKIRVLITPVMMPLLVRFIGEVTEMVKTLFPIPSKKIINDKLIHDSYFIGKKEESCL